MVFHIVKKLCFVLCESAGTSLFSCEIYRSESCLKSVKVAHVSVLLHIITQINTYDRNAFKIVLFPPHTGKQALHAKHYPKTETKTTTKKKNPKKLFNYIDYLVNIYTYVYIRM